MKINCNTNINTATSKCKTVSDSKHLYVQADRQRDTKPLLYMYCDVWVMT